MFHHRTLIYTHSCFTISGLPILVAPTTFASSGLRAQGFCQPPADFFGVSPSFLAFLPDDLDVEEEEDAFLLELLLFLEDDDDEEEEEEEVGAFRFSPDDEEEDTA